MRIGIIGSMHFTEKMLEARDQLIELGHDAFATRFTERHNGKTDKEKDMLKYEEQMHLDAIRDFWKDMQGADAVLVMNFDRKGIENYIGGNTFLEMGFAHVLNQKIFLYNPVPDMLYTAEIEAMYPTVINGDLSLITV